MLWISFDTFSAEVVPGVGLGPDSTGRVPLCTFQSQPTNAAYQCWTQRTASVRLETSRSCQLVAFSLHCELHSARHLLCFSHSRTHWAQFACLYSPACCPLLEAICWAITSGRRQSGAMSWHSANPCVSSRIAVQQVPSASVIDVSSRALERVTP